MGKCEKAPQKVIGISQFAELSACVLKQLPRDIDSGIAQEWIKNPQVLGKVLRSALCQPPPLSAINRVRTSGYLDTSFDGREVHPLVIRPLTKEQALAEYRNSSENAIVWHELENNMPYMVPNEELLNVMILDFDSYTVFSDILAEMNNLSVRPLAYEHLIQYGVVYPKHQIQKTLIGLGTRHAFFLSGLCAPSLGVNSYGERFLHRAKMNEFLNKKCCFPVVLS